METGLPTLAQSWNAAAAKESHVLLSRHQPCSFDSCCSAQTGSDVWLGRTQTMFLAISRFMSMSVSTPTSCPVHVRVYVHVYISVTSMSRSMSISVFMPISLPCL